MKHQFLFVFLLLSVLFASAQVRPGGGRFSNIDNIGAGNQNNSGNNGFISNQGNNQSFAQPRKDTLAFERRNDAKDSIAITYRFLESLKKYNIDSSINDFDNFFSVPSSWQYLGNNGAAAFPLIFKPTNAIGWDAGFHAFDIYKYSPENTRFYRTTRPFTSLNYQLASGKEQMLKASHTQNPRPNLNVGFDFKLINAPGFFVTQNTNHSSYRIFGNYQGRRKRYNAFFALTGNTINASENGGVQNSADMLDPNRKDRFAVPVSMGNAAPYQPNPFATKVNTGNIYKDMRFLLRQSYDIGKRDSVAINDSTTEYLFYPKLRFQHTLRVSKESYLFVDYAGDSTLYDNRYDIIFKKDPDSFSLQEKWNIISNDFSLVQFPDTKNMAQYLQGGVTLQQISGKLASGNVNFYNMIAHGEYRNRTRNKLWDLSADGSIYFNGLNAGDYSASASIERTLKKNKGNIRIYFSNINRTPSFVFDNRSSFHLSGNNDFQKENITSFGLETGNPILSFGARNHFLLNYSYFKNYYEAAQFKSPINIFQAFASKKIKLRKNWFYYADLTLQQTDKAAPIRVPLLFTRGRLAYEGSLFKNLKLSAGLEARYHSPYKANHYSPVIGQFNIQDTITISNLPDVSLFAHFRIRNFAGYLRAENLNTMNFSNGFGFVNNNFAAPFYPTQGLMIRFGIQWWFVN